MLISGACIRAQGRRSLTRAAARTAGTGSPRRDRFSLALLLLLMITTGAACSPEPAPEADAVRSCRQIAISPDQLSKGALLRRMPLGAGREPFRADGLRVIRDDPREVLPGVRYTEARHGQALLLPRDARAPFPWRINLSYGRMAKTKRVLAVPGIRTAKGETILLARTLHEVRRDEGGRFVELSLDLSKIANLYGEVALSAKLYSAPSRPSRSMRSQAVDIPASGSWLSYSIGVLEPGWKGGPTRFRLEACKDGDCECLHEETLDVADAQQRSWQDRLMPLDGVSGEGIRFRFETETLSAGGESISFAVWERPRLLAEAGDRVPGRHNLLLVSLDTLRADHLGAYGYSRETSPYMTGELSQRSVLFEQAIAPATATAPSHMTLFTSLPPSVHGVTSNLAPRALPEQVATLASVLQERGYVTGSVNENGALSRRMGFARGFDYFRQFFGANVLEPMGYVGAVFDEGHRFVDRHPNQRWFLFLHTYEVHLPYSPPRELASLFAEGDDPEHPDNLRLGPGRARFHPVLYDREIRHVDTALSKLMKSLQQDGRLEDTLVVITSDHGEAFNEHGTLGHGNDVYQESVHVPLFIMGPGLRGGLRIKEPVGLIDLMPTLLELLDVPAPAGMIGRSLAPLLDGSPAASERGDPLITSESWAHRASADGGGIDAVIPALAFRQGRYKLIRVRDDDGFLYELYDLERDPGEKTNLLDAGDPLPPALQALSEKLRRVAQEYERHEARIAKELELPPLETDAFEPDAISPERLEALRMLGYIE
jgi:arylsulfatase A-like enzyme